MVLTWLAEKKNIVKYLGKWRNLNKEEEIAGIFRRFVLVKKITITIWLPVLIKLKESLKLKY